MQKEFERVDVYVRARLYLGLLQQKFERHSQPLAPLPLGDLHHLGAATRGAARDQLKLQQKGQDRSPPAPHSGTRLGNSPNRTTLEPDQASLPTSASKRLAGEGNVGETPRSTLDV